MTTSSSTRKPLPAATSTAAVLTVSDSAADGTRSDISGPAIIKILKQAKFEILKTQVIADNQPAIRKALIALSAKARLVVTTGGTGISARDVTPEATRAVCKKQIEGIAERMRFEGSKKTPFAALSRGICGIRGKSIILNLPGAPKGAVDSLQSVIGILPHALQLLEGHTEHS